MNEFLLPNHSDPAFDEREQAEIISLAAALQRESGQRATLSDLERAAMEAGIEPRFVHEAVRMRQTGHRPQIISEVTVERPERWWRAFAAAALMIPAQVLVYRNFIWTNDHRFEAVCAAVAFAALFGLGMPRQSSARMIAGLWPLFVAFIIMMKDRHFAPRGTWIELLWLAAVQGAIAVAVHLARSRRAEPGVRTRMP